jgi:hypothetical protein
MAPTIAARLAATIQLIIRARSMLKRLSRLSPQKGQETSQPIIRPSQLEQLIPGT